MWLLDVVVVVVVDWRCWSEVMVNLHLGGQASAPVHTGLERLNGFVQPSFFSQIHDMDEGAILAGVADLMVSEIAATAVCAVAFGDIESAGLKQKKSRNHLDIVGVSFHDGKGWSVIETRIANASESAPGIVDVGRHFVLDSFHVVDVGWTPL